MPIQNQKTLINDSNALFNGVLLEKNTALKNCKLCKQQLFKIPMS
jgi:hypothetical protein